MIRIVESKHYLVTGINFSDPFNLIGALSPYNFFEKPGRVIATKNMVPFYFVQKDNKIFFTNETPTENYSALYLALESIKKQSGPEVDFLKKIVSLAQAENNEALNALVAPEERKSLENYFTNYQYERLVKLFQDFPEVTAIASLNTEEGKIIYFRYSDLPGRTGISSLILKKTSGKYCLSFTVKNKDVNNILQNDYVREAIFNYFRKQS